MNVRLRKEFELYANIRPARTFIPGGRYANVDIVLVRENLEGLYVGYEHFIADRRRPARGGRVDRDRDPGRLRADHPLCLRVRASRHGRKKVTIVHKANILKMVSGLFLEVGKRIAAGVRGPGRLERHDRGQLAPCSW